MGKIYVKVIAEFSEEGIIKPLSFIGQEGISYDIQKITDVRRATSLKGGGTGYRYEMIIDGKKSYLWLEDIEFNKTIAARAGLLSHKR